MSSYSDRKNNLPSGTPPLWCAAHLVWGTRASGCSLDQVESWMGTQEENLQWVRPNWISISAGVLSSAPSGICLALESLSHYPFHGNGISPSSYWWLTENSANVALWVPSNHVHQILGDGDRCSPSSRRLCTRRRPRNRIWHRRAYFYWTWTPLWIAEFEEETGLMAGLQLSHFILLRAAHFLLLFCYSYADIAFLAVLICDYLYVFYLFVRCHWPPRFRCRTTMMYNDGLRILYASNPQFSDAQRNKYCQLAVIGQLVHIDSRSGHSLAAKVRIAQGF